MKFTKEEAFEKLKGILTNSGKKPLRMSEKSVKKQLETLIPLVANDEMELDDFINKVKETFSTMNSNAEKDNADFIKEWEKNHPEPKEDPDPKPEPDPKNEPSEEMAKLMKRLEELERKETEREHERTISQKRKDLLKAMKEKGIKDEAWAKDLLDAVAITDNIDVEEKADTFLKIYNKSQAGTGGDGTTPKSTGGDDKPDDALAGARALMKNRREQREQLNNKENGK